MLIKRPDNIVSSQAREKNDYGFKPTYDTVKFSIKIPQNFLNDDRFLGTHLNELYHVERVPAKMDERA